MIEDFFSLVTNLKTIKRKGWIEKASVQNPESVADHTFSMAVMSMILAELQSLNVEKVVKMSLIHDLAESVTGDFTPHEISKEQKAELEEKIMTQIITKLPKKLQAEYQSLWDEFQEMKTNESILVHEVDKLEMVFQAKQYIDNGHQKSDFKQFLETAKNEIKNTQLKGLLNKLL